MDVYSQGKDAPQGSPAYELYAWVESLHELMDLLYGTFTEERWSHTYRSPSLKRLEKELLWYFEHPHGGDLDTIFSKSVAGYLGETLLNEVGGRWDWDENAGTSGLPVVRPDPVLGLDPVVPSTIVDQAVTEKSGLVFTETARSLRSVVRARQRKKENAGWQPERTPTPWVAREDLEAVTYARQLSDWSNRCYSIYYYTWADEAGGGIEHWNFQPESLDTMEALLRENFQTVEDYNRVADEPFWMQAAWYVGEYVVRRKRAQWQYLQVNPDAEPGTLYAADSYWTGSAFVRQRYRYDSHAEHPHEMLRAVLTGTSLREVVDRFNDPRNGGDYGP